MEPTVERLTMYDQPAEGDALEWPWVEEQLRSASVYWVVPPADRDPVPPGASRSPRPDDASRSPRPSDASRPTHPSGASRHPHPRPVWGVWADHRLYLSIGSPRINAALASPTPVTVHLGGDVDVVILEGTSAGTSHAEQAVAAYNKKYDWNYITADYGPFTVVTPAKIIAWRSAGWAGRDGFQSTGRWRFPTPEASPRP